MHVRGDAQHIATLWRMTWNDNVVSCVVYRTGDGFQLSVESPVAIVVTEKFDLEPRALARAQALRDSLKRRGWQDAAVIADQSRPANIPHE
jgi:hypothetical protein